MARFDLPPTAEVTFTELLLDRMRVASHGRIGSFVRQSARFDQHENLIADEMVFRLSAEVLAERVLDTDAEVPFSGTSHAEVKLRMRGLVLPFALAAVLALVGAFVGSLALVLGAMSVGLLAAVMLYLNTAHEQRVTLPVAGTVTVPATYWRKFPEANMAYPSELGGPVRIAVLGDPRWTPEG